MRRIVKTFLHIFLKSLFPHPGYYSKIIRSTFSFSFKYFLVLIFILNISLVLFIAIKYNPQSVDSLLSTFSTSFDRYPDDLIVSIHKGRLITNYNRPYLLWLDNQNGKNLLLVLDETATPNKIKLYGSPMLLTSQEVVLNDTKTSNVSVLPLQYLNDQKITKQKMNQVVQSIDKVRSALPVLFIIGFLLLILLVPSASFIVTFIYLFLATCIVFFVFKLFLQKHFHFRKIFQISFHAITFPLLLDYLVMVVKPTIRMGPSFLMPLKQIPFPMLFLIILAVFVAMGVYEAHEDEKHLEKPVHVSVHHRPTRHHKKR